MTQSRMIASRMMTIHWKVSCCRANIMLVVYPL